MSTNRNAVVAALTMLSVLCGSTVTGQQERSYDLRLKPTSRQSYYISQETRWIEGHANEPVMHQLILWRYQLGHERNVDGQEYPLLCSVTRYPLDKGPTVSLAKTLEDSIGHRAARLTDRNRYDPDRTEPPNELFQVPLPTTPVKVGDGWAWRYELTMPGPQQDVWILEWKCELGGEEIYQGSECVRIEYSWSFKPREEENPHYQMSGYSLFDPEEGLFLKKEEDAKVKRLVRPVTDEWKWQHTKLVTIMLVPHAVEEDAGGDSVQQPQEAAEDVGQKK